MTDVEDTAGGAPPPPVDGRVARRERNIDTVLDVVLELFEGEQLFPTIDQVATRSGLSLRSLYRYFRDQSELVEAAVVRTRERSAELAHLHAIGQGPLPRRIDEFVEMRVGLHERMGASFRATTANAARHPRLQAELSRTREALREQFDLQFAPELAALPPSRAAAVGATGDVLTQFDSIGQLRRDRALSVADTTDALRETLTALLAPPST